jgi:hypothetical protein
MEQRSVRLDFGQQFLRLCSVDQRVTFRFPEGHSSSLSIASYRMVTPAGPFIVAVNSAATCFASVNDSNSRISPFDLSQDWREPVTPPLTDA